MMRPILKIITLCLVAGGFAAGPAQGQTRFGGTISEDTRLTRDQSPYVVVEDIYVKPGVTLTIEPGVALRFKSHIKDGHGYNASQLELLVEGRLEGVGAARDSIRFTSASDDPDHRDWQGIVVRDGGTLHLENAYIENAIAGVLGTAAEEIVLKHVSIFSSYHRGVNITQSKAYLEDLYITNIGNRYGSGVGIEAGYASEVEIYNCFLVGAQTGILLYGDTYAKIHHSVISNAVKWGIGIKKSNAEVSYCSITGNDYGIVLMSGSLPSIHHNNIFQNGVADVWFRHYDEEVSVDLSNNWWEKQDVADIQRAVFDGTRDPDVKAFALVEPILAEAVATDPNAN